MNKRKILFSILGLLVFLFVFLPMVCSHGGGKKNDTENNNSSNSPKLVKIGKVRHLYHFRDFQDGKLKRILDSDAEFFPQGGRIKITPPSRKWWIDIPGVPIYRPKEQRGEFIFETDTTASPDNRGWGVVIYN